MYAYTGEYKGKKITVMASGMGMPSMGIYSYELYKFYNVDTIIRIGSCGTFSKDIKIFDTILVDKSYTEGNFALAMNSETCHTINSSSETLSKIQDTASKNNIPIIKGNILCNEYFDPYMEDINKLFYRLPKDLNLIGSEMESFALFSNSNSFTKRAAILHHKFICIYAYNLHQ